MPEVKDWPDVAEEVAFLDKHGFKNRYKLRNSSDPECSPEDAVPIQISFWELANLLHEFKHA
jgi:hypothetical protein